MSFVESHMRESLKNFVLEDFPAGDMKAFYLRHPTQGMMGSCLILFTPEGIVICGDRAPSKTGRGAITAFLYGLDWFASELYEDYLCLKFLDKEWVPEYAADYCRRMAKELRAGKQDGHYDSSGELKKASDERAGYIEQYVDLRSDRKNFPEDMEIWKKQAKYLLEKTRPLTGKIRAMRDEIAQAYEVLIRDLEDGYCWAEKFAEDLREFDPHGVDDGIPGYGYPPSEAGWLCAIQQKFRELYQARVTVKA